VSGKGGTGKTSIASSLAILLSKKHKIMCADCDVDTPNLGLLLGLNEKNYSWKRLYTSEKPALISNKCIGCRACLNTCVFNAISWKNEKPVFNKLLCEGCGACEIVCPADAIKFKKVNNAMLGIASSHYGFKIVTGQLKMGESGSGKIVSLVKQEAERIAKNDSCEFILVDSAAGTGCPAIASIQGSSYVIAVTEPSPSALSDLNRTLAIVRHFRIPYGVIINKYDLNKKYTLKIKHTIQKQNAQLLGLITYDDAFIKSLLNLEPVIVHNKELEALFSDIIKCMYHVL